MGSSDLLAKSSVFPGSPPSPADYYREHQLDQMLSNELGVLPTIFELDTFKPVQEVVSSALASLTQKDVRVAARVYLESPNHHLEVEVSSLRFRVVHLPDDCRVKQEFMARYGQLEEPEVVTQVLGASNAS